MAEDLSRMSQGKTDSSLVRASCKAAVMGVQPDRQAAGAQACDQAPRRRVASGTKE